VKRQAETWAIWNRWTPSGSSGQSSDAARWIGSLPDGAKVGNPLEAAWEVHRFQTAHQVPYATIGGLAVQH
jgi:hypothetical protein